MTLHLFPKKTHKTQHIKSLNCTATGAFHNFTNIIINVIHRLKQSDLLILKLSLYAKTEEKANCRSTGLKK